MSYSLIECKLVGPIDRIRGESDITVSVNCVFKDLSGNTFSVPGVANCTKSESLSEAIASAMENAKQNIAKLKGTTVDTGTTGPKINKNLSAVMKTAIAPALSSELRKHAPTRSEYDKMTEEAGEDKQQKITGLCEALGIDIIDVLTEKWSNIEVLVLINYLERMTEPLSVGE